MSELLEFQNQIIELSKDVAEIKTILRCIPCKDHSEEIKQNTAFRHKMNGHIAIIAVVVGLVVGIVDVVANILIGVFL